MTEQVWPFPRLTSPRVLIVTSDMSTVRLSSMSGLFTIGSGNSVPSSLLIVQSMENGPPQLWMVQLSLPTAPTEEFCIRSECSVSSVGGEKRRDEIVSEAEIQYAIFTASAHYGCVCVNERCRRKEEKRKQVIQQQSRATQHTQGIHFSKEK